MMPSFATSINCIDGRVQGPLSEWIRENYDVEFVDMVSEPGCDLVLSGPSETEAALRAKVGISVNAHKSRLVFVSGHHECAANPVTRDEHVEHVRKAAARIASWGLPVQVVGLWVNDSWNVDVIT